MSLCLWESTKPLQNKPNGFSNISGTLRNRYGEQLLQDMSTYGLFVFPTHVAEWNNNKAQLLKTNRHTLIAKMSAVIKDNMPKMPQVEKLVVYSKICSYVKMSESCEHAILMFHLVCNGSIGKVIDIVYLDGRCPKDSLPDVVMVDFAKYTGPAFIPGAPTVLSVVPVERTIDCFVYGCKRKQIPLRLGWGTTIHWCQGMTIGRGETNRYIVIDSGTKQSLRQKKKKKKKKKNLALCV